MILWPPLRLLLTPNLRRFRLAWLKIQSDVGEGMPLGPFRRRIYALVLPNNCHQVGMWYHDYCSNSVALIEYSTARL
ncbi:hypothetical protein TNCV_552711 [Trichonephila clavipes]|nr:hypothetical protein TNCV_552711 [Trichonephila clavipes]